MLTHGRKALPNRFKSMRVHVGLAVFYGLIGFALAAALLFVSHTRWNFSTISGLLTVACLAMTHGWIALGASKANSLAQAASVVAGVLMLAAFPLGTLIGVYLLANAKWSDPELIEEGPSRASVDA